MRNKPINLTNVIPSFSRDKNSATAYAFICLLCCLAIACAHDTTTRTVRDAEPANQYEMEQAGAEGLADAEGRLQSALNFYKLTLYDDDIAALNQVQAVWEMFREMDCTSIVAPHDRYGVGTLEWLSCMNSRTNHRAEEIWDLARCDSNDCFPVRKPKP